MRSWAALGAALALLGAPAAALAASSPATIDLGGVPGYVRSDPGTTLVTLELFVRAGLDRQTPAQNGLAALTAEALLHAPVDGLPLIDAVEARGGSISYSVSGQYVRFALEAQPATVAALAMPTHRVVPRPLNRAFSNERLCRLLVRNYPGVMKVRLCRERQVIEAK